MEPFLCSLFALFLTACQPDTAPISTPAPPAVAATAPAPMVVPTTTPLPTRAPSATPTARTLRLPPPAQATEIANGPSTTNKVALTFDAGIRSPHIVPILDQLKAANVRSTMFLTGWWADQHPEIVARMVAEGHEMGNHSYSHPNFTEISNAAIREEVERGNAAIARHGGTPTKPWFRPPSGDRDARVNRTIGELGYYSIYWSLDTLDWMEDVTAQQVLERTISRTTPGAIIVAHLTSPQTAQVLSEMIRRLRERGFELVLVSELLSEP